MSTEERRVQFESADCGLTNNQRYAIFEKKPMLFARKHFQSAFFDELARASFNKSLLVSGWVKPKPGMNKYSKLLQINAPFKRTYDLILTMHPNRDSLERFSSVTTFSQHLLQGKLLSFRTSYCVELRPQAQQMVSEVPEIIGFPCEMLNNQLRRCYKICYKDAVIMVEDKITYEADDAKLQKQEEQPANCSSTYEHSCKKKMVLFKNAPFKRDELDSKIDKKNIVKNVTNAFLKYLKDQESTDDIIHTVIATVQTLIKTLKFNNSLITAIVRLEQPRQCFKYFLGTSAVEWIENSKIKTKDLYIRAVQVYAKLCGDKEKAMRAQNRVLTLDRADSYTENSMVLRDLENYDLEQEIRGFK